LSIYRQPAEANAYTSRRRLSALPVPRTSFVGRSTELARVEQLLAESRVLTLLGPGGSGKTRLAIRLALDVAQRFPAGRFFVDLAPLDRGGRVISRVAETVGVEEPEGGEPVSEAVCERLRGGPALVVLDNCEHVVEGAAEVAAVLLSGVDVLTILATSREPLAVEGELTWTVPALTDQDAMHLFHQRAAMVRPDRPLSVDDDDAVMEVCRRLDGLPLAIELAAARTRTLSPRQIASRLEQRFELLANGPRTVPARQATLRASIDWSYELLGEERAVLRHLAVFAGSFDMDALIAVHPSATVEQLAALVDRSLVVVEDVAEGNRYRLPESIRAYALERLAADGEHDRARANHLDHYLALAERAEPHISGPERLEWLTRLGIDHDNIVAALTWAHHHHQCAHLARLAVAMTPYWLEHSQWSECGTWLDAAATAGDVPPALRAQVLICRCYLETWNGHWAVVPGLAGEALTLARTAGATREEGRALGYLAVITALTIGADPARPYFESATTLVRSTGDTWGVANLFTFFSLCRLFQADASEPAQLLDEAMAVARERGDGRTLRLASAVAALAAVTRGRLDEAATFAAHAIEEARKAEHWSALIVGLAADGWVRVLRGDADSAVAASTEAVVVAQQSGELRPFQAVAMSVCGWALHSQGHLDAALATLGDAVELMRGSELPRWIGLPLVFLAEAQLNAGDQASARGSLEEATAVATAAGYPWILGRAKQTYARLLADAGDYAAAESHFHDALALHKIASDLVGWCDGLDRLAAVCTARGRPDVALRLWGAVEARRASLGVSASPVQDSVRAAIVDARRASGASAQTFWAEGNGLDLDQATDYAARQRGRRGRPTSGWDSLTPSELAVVRLIGQHRTNPQIAEQLFVSRATVKTHLIHIFVKLNITSRSELAARAICHGLQ
jgi:predicted ATPase/DNA-binding CsgD family transcriptional regulator